nr:movement protein [Ipomoea batatas]
MNKLKAMLPFVRHVETPEYQNYGKLTFIEIDDVINYKLPDHPSKTLFDVKRENKEKGEIMIKTNTRNLSCRKEILLSVFEEDDFAKTKGYYHVALVQVMVMWLGNTVQDIPLTIVALEKQKIMGIFSSNLYPWATYTELYTDLTISARDPTKLQAFLLDIKAKVEFEIPQSLGLSVSLKVTYSWTQRPQAFRIRDKSKGKDGRRRVTISPKSWTFNTRLRPDTLHQRRVFDKGILLSLANPNTWDAELKAWETSMVIYFGNHPEMAVEERLKYMVATMTDFARIWWSSYETTPEYEDFLNAFRAGDGK